MGETLLEIQLDTGTAVVKLKTALKAWRTGAKLGITDFVIYTRGKVKAGLGQAGRPKSRTGAAGLSGSIVHDVSEDASSITGIVGPRLPYKTGYAAILEKGGPLPAMTIRPKKGKVLAWPIGVGKFAFRQSLSAGSTMKQARGAAIKAHNRSVKGLGGGFAYARVVHIPARYQRAMPYIQPEWDAATPRAPILIRGRIKAELTKGGIGEGTGEK